MAPRVYVRKTLPRKPAGQRREHFFPGEVVRILGLEGVDYYQLRRLFRLVRRQAASSAPNPKKWGRFAFQDLVALKTLVRLAGGKEALKPGKRLRLKELETACERLRVEFGIDNPLTEVVLDRRGKRVVAKVDGIWLEPADGQLVLSEVRSSVEAYLEQRPNPARDEKGFPHREDARKPRERARKPKPIPLSAEASL